MDAVPLEVWHGIFTFACTDDGYTGRSLSLVSTYFHDISAPFKYQSLAITHWTQIIAFSNIFCQLPASQKKIKYLFVHHPYPFLDIRGHQITDNDQTSEECQSEVDMADSEGSEESHSKSDTLDSENEEGLLEDKYLNVLRDPPETLDIVPAGDSDSQSDSDSTWFTDADSGWASPSDSEHDSDFEGSLNSEEELEVMDDVWYLKRDRDRFPQARESDNWLSGSLSGSDSSWQYYGNDSDSECEASLDSEEEQEIFEDADYLVETDRLSRLQIGSTRDDVQRDAEIQAFFDNVLQAFHDILNETSSTLTILAVYWTSFKPLCIHELLPPLPCLEELHISRFPSLGDIYEEPPATVLFPRLLFLYTSHGEIQKLYLFASEIARIAPNLTHLRCTSRRESVTSH